MTPTPPFTDDHGRGTVPMPYPTGTTVRVLIGENWRYRGEIIQKGGEDTSTPWIRLSWGVAEDIVVYLGPGVAVELDTMTHPALAP